MSSRLDEITDWAARVESRKHKVSAVARDCGVGERQFQRYFRAQTGSTPKKTFNVRRLLQALTHLQEGKSVKQAADKAGYASPQHFSKAFKKFHGISPSSVPTNHSLGSFAALPSQNPPTPS